jgi:hypothetical protein
MRPRAHRRRARRHIAGTVAAAAFLLAALGAAGYGLLGRETVDARACPSSGPAGHLVLLVDKTDPFTRTQRLAFAELLREIATARVARGELVSVFVLGESVDAAVEPVFERCNPGSAQDASKWNANPERLRRQYEQNFLEPLAAVAQHIQVAKPAAVSPIMEMLQLVAINGFRRNAVHGPRRLIVVSDMLQNTNEYSHYRGEASFERLRERPYFQRVRVDLSGVAVELRYLMHAPALQNRGHARFWEAYIREMGASLTAVRLVEG